VAKDWERIFSAVIGAGRVSTDSEVRKQHSGDKWFAARLPDLVITPQSAQEVAAVLRVANEERIPVTARGSGYGYVGGCVPERGGVALALGRMNRIREIAVPDGVAIVEPGVITGELQSQVRKHGLFYPPDPASLKNSSIGGNIATNAGGPRCLKYGVTRNYVLGLEVCLADGHIARLGGRTLKNKTGFDLVGLFVGSEGMLGVVTEATLRLLPLPPTRGCLSGGFANMSLAANAVQRVLLGGFLPAALEIADRFTLEAAREHMSHRLVPAGDAHLLLEVDGQPESVEFELAQLSKLLAGLGAQSVSSGIGEEACEEFWDLRRGFSESLRATGLTKLNEDVVVPRGRLVDLVEFAGVLQRRFGFPVACFGHAGDGNIHVNIMVPDLNEPGVADRAEEALDALFSRILDWGGAITGEHGIGLAKKRWWPQAVPTETIALHTVVKKALDPNGILNPGKFLG
jgi:glycolate oxidase